MKHDAAPQPQPASLPRIATSPHRYPCICYDSLESVLQSFKASRQPQQQQQEQEQDQQKQKTTRRMGFCPAFGARMLLSPQFRASFKALERQKKVLRFLGMLLDIGFSRYFGCKDNLYRKKSRRQRKNYNLQYFGPFEGRKWPLLANPEFHAFCMLWNTNVIMVGHGCSGHRMLLEHERYYGWAWMLWPPYAFGTRTLLWFGMDALVTVSLWNTHVNMVGHGCSRHRMLLEHGRYYGLGMDALVTICLWHTHVNMDALVTVCFWNVMVGHGCSDHLMLWEHERYYGWAWMLWSLYAFGTRTLLWFGMDDLVTVCFWNTHVNVVGHGCSRHRMLLEHECYYGWAWMLWSPYAFGTRMLIWLGMDALVTVCFWNTNVTMVGAWMLWSPYAFGTRTLLWLGMDALVTVCFWNTNVTMVVAWMLWSPYAFGTRTLLWFGTGALVTALLWLGMDALVTACLWNTSVIMVWARMLW